MVSLSLFLNFFASSLTIRLSAVTFLLSVFLPLVLCYVSNRSSGHILLGKYQDTRSGKGHLYLECVSMCECVFVCVYVCLCVYEKERERERERERE